MSKLGPIFETYTTTLDRVSVAVETLRHGGAGLVVRDWNGSAVMGLPVEHVSRPILAEMFTATDGEAILARISE